MQDITLKQKNSCRDRLQPYPLHLGNLWRSSKSNASPEFCGSILAKTQGEQCRTGLREQPGI